ncbi:MAG: putative toxin-antitoxin system toxin component, PIN family [Clostridiales Family XIII bacterium]|jgi:putative PIN family toxin of toxin-antitoxin system|nr:putative toxin-antitoxin system toxin component, PIN family [Clostridiales Family XIII bacterium]
MRILIDTNILLSAMWFKNSRVAKTLLYVADNHELVLCDRNVTEMRDVIKRKTPNILADAEVFLSELSYELILSVENAEKLIRDPKDQPILNAAIVNGVDVILTGDKDFLCLDLESPKPMAVAQFLESEGIEL